MALTSICAPQRRPSPLPNVGSTAVETLLVLHWRRSSARPVLSLSGSLSQGSESTRGMCGECQHTEEENNRRKTLFGLIFCWKLLRSAIIGERNRVTAKFILSAVFMLCIVLGNHIFKLCEPPLQNVIMPGDIPSYPIPCTPWGPVAIPDPLPCTPAFLQPRSLGQASSCTTIRPLAPSQPPRPQQLPVDLLLL